MKYSKKVAMIFHLACFPKMLFCLSSRILQAIFLSCSQSSLDLAATSQQVIGEGASFAVNQIVLFHLPLYNTGPNIVSFWLYCIFLEEVLVAAPRKSPRRFTMGTIKNRCTQPAILKFKPQKELLNMISDILSGGNINEKIVSRMFSKTT